GCWGHKLLIWDVAKRRSILTIKCEDGVYDVAWSPDGKKLVANSNKETAQVWDAVSGKELLRLKGHTLNVCDVAWSRDGKRIATGSMDSTVKVWDARTGRELRTFEGHVGSVDCVAWSPDGKRLLSGGDDRTVKFWAVDE